MRKKRGVEDFALHYEEVPFRKAVTYTTSFLVRRWLTKSIARIKRK
jgi:hypothetical protein